MDGGFLQTDTGYTHPRGYSMPDSGLLQWQESTSKLTPKLPQIEVANIEIAALADLYQQQLAEICAEHSLLLEDQSKLAKLIAPFLDEHGYVTGEFSETVLLLKQGLDLRLLEYEEDCRRIQQTERRLQRRIDDILVNYELLASEAQGLAESRLQEQIKDMRRIIRVLQSELDETRFQRDVYADETRRLRGICRFGYWVEDGYGASGAAADELGTLVEAPSHGTAQTSPLSGTTIRRPRQPQLPLTCVTASQRARRTDDSMTREQAEVMSINQDTGEKRGRRHRSQMVESDISEEECKRKPVETQEGKGSEPSLFQEVLAKLLGGTERTKGPAAQNRNMHATVSAVRQRESEASLPRVLVAARGSAGERTNGKETTAVRRPQAASMEQSRREDQRSEDTQSQQQRAQTRQEVRRGVSAASRDSDDTVEGVRPVHRSRTVPGEQTVMRDDVHNQRMIEKTRVARSRSSDASEEETTEKEPRRNSTTRRGSLRTGPGNVLDNRKDRSTVEKTDDRIRAVASSLSPSTGEALLQRATLFGESVNGWWPATQETDSKRYSPPHAESKVLERRAASDKEETSGFAPSPRTSLLADDEKMLRGLVPAAGSDESASFSAVEVPLRGSVGSGYQHPSQAKEPVGTREAFPRRFQSRTLASPRLPGRPAASSSEDRATQPEPAADAGTLSHDLLVPAWRRARTMRSPLSRRSMESAPESPRLSDPGAGREPEFSAERCKEDRSTRWHRNRGWIEQDGRPAQRTSAALLKRSAENHVPHSGRPGCSNSRPGATSPVSRYSSALSSTRRLDSPRYFGRITASTAAAAPLGFHSRD